MLKGLKRKISQKQLNVVLSQRQVFNFDGAIQSLGVIINIDEDENLQLFSELAANLKIPQNKFKIIAFSEDNKRQVSSWEECYKPKDFTLKGIVKNGGLETFINAEFDLLISFYEKDIIELKLITAYSSAKFKVGILQTDERVNDLIIKTNVKQFKVFKTELFKYLNILSKK